MQVPNMAPILGEIAFFLGIVQPMTVRAQPDGDVQLLVLSRDDSNELFNNYPEQVLHMAYHDALMLILLLFLFGSEFGSNSALCRNWQCLSAISDSIEPLGQLELIRKNILSHFGLDLKGKDTVQVAPSPKGPEPQPYWHN